LIPAAVSMVNKAWSKPYPISGLLSGRHLMWVIHSRDTWMYRLDICRATGRKFEQSSGTMTGLRRW